MVAHLGHMPDRCLAGNRNISGCRGGMMRNSTNNSGNELQRIFRTMWLRWNNGHRNTTQPGITLYQRAPVTKGDTKAIRFFGIMWNRAILCSRYAATLNHLPVTGLCDTVTWFTPRNNFLCWLWVPARLWGSSRWMVWGRVKSGSQHPFITLSQHFFDLTCLRQYPFRQYLSLRRKGT
jgi:hypothetical protein